jgi:S1-C subfamily serine protease
MSASTNSGGGALAALSTELADAVERAGQSVVTVEARRRVPGSGIVWPEGGVIVTADHVLERHEEITVVFAGGERVAATVAGRDPGSDVAILKPASSAGQAAQLAPADSVRAGNLALAVGRGGEGLPGVSFGIISAVGGSWRTGRGGTLDGYLRADLTLYPGFSGGPLVDTEGRVLGVNSSAIAGGQSIAIPSAVVSGIVQTLLTHGKIRRGYLGVTSRPVEIPASLKQKAGSDQASGLLVMGVETGSPAEAGGLIIGDVLLAVNGQQTAHPEALQAALAGEVVGKNIVVKVLRGGETKDVPVTPQERQ